jgi:acyl-CoA synthetase (AMP-forming)/AMP-acid ligase II/F0F1-type ATP synthase assembly protein I
VNREGQDLLFFARRLERFGDAPALILESGETLTYAELARRADDFGERLGAERSLLLIEAENQVEAVIAYLGALRAGHPIILSGGGSDGARRLVETYRPNWRFHVDGSEWRLDATGEGGRELHPELALMLSTSGTTGATKLVRLSANNIDANARSIATYLGIAAGDRPITSLPLHYSYGLSVLNSHLASGAALLLTERSVIDPAFWTFFDAHGATSIAGVPYTYELLERVGFRDRDLPTLRTMTQAGGRLPPELVTRYGDWARSRGVRFFVMYGQTEATARISYVPPERLEGNERTIGVPIPAGELRLIDDEGRTIDAAGEAGELVYRGPNVMLGYAEGQGDLARGRELEELRTGDLAVREPSGFFRITGRKSRFSKLFGLRVNLDEVEAQLARLHLRGAAAGNDTLVAVAYLGDLPPEAVRGKLAEALSLPAEAFEAEQVADLPLLSSGKVDYRTILARAEARRAAAPVDPNSDFGTLFAAAFPGRPIAPSDSFVSLGGDSLVYVTLAGEIETRLGHLPRGWEGMSVEALAAKAEGAPRAVRVSSIDSEILLRALAILAVVINHASSYAVGGGAEALLMLAGFNMARFNQGRFVEGRFWQAIGSFALRVVLPVYLIIVAFAIVREDPPASSFVMASVFEGRFGSILEPFWFIETLLHCFLLVGFISWLPAARRLAATQPFQFGLVLLGLAVAMRLAGPLLFDHAPLGGRSVDQLFFLVALGWCAYFAGSLRAKLGIAAATLLFAALNGGLVSFPGWIASDKLYRLTWLVAGMGLLLFVPRIPIPALLRRALIPLAAASFSIYVVHGLPIYAINEHIDRSLELTKIVIGVASGLIFHWLVLKIVRRTRRVRAG